jgi:hypothetical protein
MNLDASAVEFVLEGKGAREQRESLAHVAHRMGKHWLERPRLSGGGDGRLWLGSSRIAFAQYPDYPPHIALEHVNAPDLRNRATRHPRDGLEHEPLAHSVAHLPYEDLGNVFALERACPLKQGAQQLELAPSRIASFDGRNLGKASVDLSNRKPLLCRARTQPERHFDRLAKIHRGGKDLFALLLRTAHLGDDLPDRAAAYLKPLFFALRNGPSNHEARSYLGLAGGQPSKEFAGQLRYLEAALSLAERLANLGESMEGPHRAIKSASSAQFNKGTPRPSCPEPALQGNEIFGRAGIRCALARARFLAPLGMTVFGRSYVSVPSPIFAICPLSHFRHGRGRGVRVPVAPAGGGLREHRGAPMRLRAGERPGHRQGRLYGST